MPMSARGDVTGGFDDSTLDASVGATMAALPPLTSWIHQSPLVRLSPVGKTEFLSAYQHQQLSQLPISTD
jgi:hypothetical protein